MAAAPVAAAAAVGGIVGGAEIPDFNPPPFQPSAPVEEEPVLMGDVCAPAPENAPDVPQPEAPVAPVEAGTSVPLNDASAFPNQFAGAAAAGAASAPAAQPDAPKPSVQDTFVRTSWRDESLNNGGIVNQGPRNP